MSQEKLLRAKHIMSFFFFVAVRKGLSVNIELLGFIAEDISGESPHSTFSYVKSPIQYIQYSIFFIFFVKNISRGLARQESGLDLRIIVFISRKIFLKIF